MLILGFWATYFKVSSIIGAIIVVISILPPIVQYFEDKAYFDEKENKKDE